MYVHTYIDLKTELGEGGGGRGGGKKKGERTDQTVAFIVGHVHWKTGGESLLENIQLSSSGCIVHASCKSNHLRCDETASISHVLVTGELDVCPIMPISCIDRYMYVCRCSYRFNGCAGIYMYLTTYA